MNFNLIIVIALIILVVIITIVDSIKNRKEESIGHSLIGAGLMVILAHFPQLTELIIQLIFEFLEIEITNTNPPYPVCLIIGLMLIGLGMFSEYSIQKKTLVLNMFGIASQKVINDAKTIKDLKLPKFSIHEQIVDLVPFWDNLNDMKLRMNIAICKYIKNATQRFSSAAGNEKQTCFTGMAPIPYTVYAGTFLNDAKTCRYFEYNAQNDGYYELKRLRRLERKKSWAKMKVKFSENITSNATDILLCISVTHQITVQDTCQFTMDKVDVYLDEPKDNIIEYYQQLIDYKETIYNLLNRQIKNRYPNIHTIHIAAAIPSCLAVEIGKIIGMRTNRLCDIIVYHYIQTEELPYTFGVHVNGKNKDKLELIGR